MVNYILLKSKENLKDYQMKSSWISSNLPEYSRDTRDQRPLIGDADFDGI